MRTFYPSSEYTYPYLVELHVGTVYFTVLIENLRHERVGFERVFFLF